MSQDTTPSYGKFSFRNLLVQSQQLFQKNAGIYKINKVTWKRILGTHDVVKIEVQNNIVFLMIK